MRAFATELDVYERWPDAPEDDSRINVLLEDAAVNILADFPQIPDSPDSPLSHLLKTVSVAMVKRALVSEDTGHLSNEMMTAGPFSRQFGYRNPDGALYLTGQERARIATMLGGRSGMVTVEAQGG